MEPQRKLDFLKTLILNDKHYNFAMGVPSKDFKNPFEV
jgi:hypothetical protein